MPHIRDGGPVDSNDVYAKHPHDRREAAGTPTRRERLRGGGSDVRPRRAGLNRIHHTTAHSSSSSSSDPPHHRSLLVLFFLVQRAHVRVFLQHVRVLLLRRESFFVSPDVVDDGKHRIER